MEKGKGVPLWMGDTNWKALQALSSTEEFKKKSAINKQNRLMNNAHHSCGSIPISEHKRRLAKDFKREPHVDEIFTHTHKRHDGTFVDDRARDTIAKYNEGMTRATQMTESGSSQLKMTPLEVFAEAAGGMKKGKLYESSQQRNAENVDDLRQQMATMTEQMTQMQKKINELENKGSPPGHPSAEEIGAVVFAKMSTLFPAFGGQ